MGPENEEALLPDIESEVDEISLADLEQTLEAQLEEELGDLAFLEEEREHIDNPDHLGETVLNVVWEQFLNQVAVTAGEDFIAENRGLTLDLHGEAHIQTTEAFAAGVIAAHNTKIDYQKRHDDWQSQFQTGDKGEIITHKTRSGKEEATLVKGARAPFDAGRPSGSLERHTDMDHIIPAAEIIRDPAFNAHLTLEEQIAFANSEANLMELDSSLNRSKGDKATTEWLDNPNSKGQKPAEIFDISEDDDQKLRQGDAEARKEAARRKEEGEKRSIETGKQSQKEEFYRIGKVALRTALMTLLATLLKVVIGKLVLWLKSAERNLNTLISHIKMAVLSFVNKLKDLLKQTTESVLTTIATAIIGPVVGIIKKIITLLRQGWRSLKEAVQYLREPENRGKPLSYLLPQVGIIVVTGLSGVGAIALGEFIEKALMGIPFLAVDIPLLGSPANLIGMLMGAIVCGIIGAIAIHLINKRIAQQQKNDNLDAQIDKKNEIIATQDALLNVKGEQLNITLQKVAQDIPGRHKELEAQLVAMGEEDMDTEITEMREEESDPAISEMQRLSQEELDRMLQDL